jgi:hypothetical protein
LLKQVEARLKEVTTQRDFAIETEFKLQAKLSEMYRLLQVASDEQNQWQLESETLIVQLELENNNLRKLLILP